MNRAQARRRRGERSKQPRSFRRTPPDAQGVEAVRISREVEFCSAWAHETYRYWAAAKNDDIPISFVYFIRETGAQGPIKIGTAVRPGSRCAELQCGNPRRLYITQLIVGSRRTEVDLHLRWNEARLAGEWFGNGYEPEILTFAERAAKRQIDAHKRGDDRAFIAATDWRSRKTIDP